MLRALVGGWRWAVVVLALGCGDAGLPIPEGGTTDAASSTGVAPMTGSNADDDSTSGGGTCPNGSWGCACRDGGDPCDALFRCERGVCVECATGLLGCPCSPSGACATSLICDADVCTAPPGACPTAADGTCDEPEAGGTCEDGSDPFDCCATLRDGVCEEQSAGGACPPGSDFYDCGGCMSQGNGWCDEPQGLDNCPAGSDPFDCCATQKDGICEERSFGGRCGDGTDHFDCGYCPFTKNGSCQEPNFCPPGSDAEDCDDGETGTGSGSSTGEGSSGSGPG